MSSCLVSALVWVDKLARIKSCLFGLCQKSIEYFCIECWAAGEYPEVREIGSAYHSVVFVVCVHDDVGTVKRAKKETFKKPSSGAPTK